MKKLILALLLVSPMLGFGQQSMNMNMLSNLDIDTIPSHTYGTFNDVWGYVGDDGREYAIMGSAAFIHFIDVTDPANPIQIDAIAGGTSTVWRDFKTYGDRVYAVSDNSGEGLIIFDVSGLPAEVTVTYQSGALFSEAHNIFIDEPNGRLYAVGTDVQGSGVVVLDIATNPDQPQMLANVNLISGLIGGYSHDLYVRDNIAYCSHGNTDSFVIWDFTIPHSPQYIASYSSNGYNHSNWVSEDGNTVVFAEEVPTGLPMGILDISDKANDNLSLYTYFKFPLLAPSHQNATPHNPYIIGDLVYTSYYEDGVQIFDISDPNNPKVAAYYDTFTDNTSYNGYNGCWGLYPFLPSGNILASDMKYGLFVLETDFSPVSAEELKTVNRFEVFPNPTTSQLTIDIDLQESEEVVLELFSLTGQRLQVKNNRVSGPEQIQMDLSDIASGIYILKASFGEGTISEKIVKQ